MMQIERCIRCVHGELKQHPTEFHLLKECPHQAEIVWEIQAVQINKSHTIHRNTSHCPRFYSIDSEAKGVCLECAEKRMCRFNPVLCKVVWTRLGWEGGE